MRLLSFLLVIVPITANAQSIFTEEDDVLRKEESSLLGSMFGTPQQSPHNNWGRFKSLQEYGQSPASIAEVHVPPDAAEIKAAQDYYNSKDPFSNGNRLDHVYENLAPKK